MIDYSMLGYTSEQMLDILKANRQVSFAYELRDKDNTYIGQVTATGSIDYDTSLSVIRSGNFTIKEYNDINRLDDRLVPYMCISTPLGTAKYPLGLFILTTPTSNYNGRVTEQLCTAYDYGMILKEDKFDSRYRVVSGTTYTGAVETILSGANIINYYITASDKTTSSDIEFEVGTSKLDAINQLLSAINYTKLYFDENGQAQAKPYVVDYLRDIEMSYIADKDSIIRPNLTLTNDQYTLPNKVVRWVENPDTDCLIATAEITDTSNKLCAARRGRTIVDAQAVSDIADQTTLNALAERTLYEKCAYETLSFESALMPLHGYQNCISFSSHGIAGIYVEQSWQMELQTGGRMTHNMRKVVPIA